jgi:uncharacterized protein (DUF1778 family)
MTAKNDARLTVRLPAQLIREIEKAAAQLGQTVSGFAVSMLVHTASRFIREQRVTVLTQRDWERLTALIEDTPRHQGQRTLAFPPIVRRCSPGRRRWP